MKEDKDFLAKEPIGKLLLKLALPTVAAQIINMLYNIVDRIYIGHIEGVGAMALTGDVYKRQVPLLPPLCFQRADIWWKTRLCSLEFFLYLSLTQWLFLSRSSSLQDCLQT